MPGLHPVDAPIGDRPENRAFSVLSPHWICDGGAGTLADADWLSASFPAKLEQALYLAFFIKPNPVGRRRARQSGHGHDVSTHDHDKSRSSGKPDLSD